MSYTFGDTDEASQRLRRLAEVYEPETRALIESARLRLQSHPVPLAVDLGCGPGWTTALLHDVLRPRRTVGLELSERYLAQARANHPNLEFLGHDVLLSPYPVAQANVLLCRFLLTHLAAPAAALRSWAGMAAPGALLLVHETEALQSNDPVLRRYYEMVELMQRHYGQELNVGATLDASFAGSGWQILSSQSIVLEKPAPTMATLHLANLRTWGKNEFAAQAFAPQELATLDAALARITTGEQPAGVVRNTARQILARRVD